MNKHAYVTVIRILGKLLNRTGLDKQPGFGGNWDTIELSYLQQARDEYQFYHAHEKPEDGERAVSAGDKRKSTRAA